HANLKRSERLGLNVSQNFLRCHLNQISGTAPTAIRTPHCRIFAGGVLLSIKKSYSICLILVSGCEKTGNSGLQSIENDRNGWRDLPGRFRGDNLTETLPRL